MKNTWPLGPSEQVLRAERVIEILQLRAEQQPERVAYTYLRSAESQTLTYGQLFEDAQRVATLLLAKLSAGDRVVLLFGSGLDFIRAFMGCHVAGVIPVPVMPPRASSPEELTRITAIVQDTEAGVVVTTAQLAQMGSAFFPSAPGLQWLSIENLEGLERTAPVSREQAGELALLQYTSGSTSSPRGVMVGHDNLMHNLSHIYWAEQNRPETVSLSWLPMSHDMGLIEGVLQPLYSGHHGYLMSPVAFMRKPLRWLQAISEYGVTVSGGPNFAYDLLLNRLGSEPLMELAPELDLSRWRFAYCGSEQVRVPTIEAFCARMAGVGFQRKAFRPLYGLAEATLGVTEGRAGGEPRYQRRVDGSGERLLVSCGTTAEGMEMRIVDPRSHELVSPGEEGEIWLAGPCVTRGYWRRPEQTQDTFAAQIKGEEKRYLRTGDLGFVLEEGLYISGRIKELIVSRGQNVYATDLEQTAEAAESALRRGGAAAFAVQGEQESAGIVAEISRTALAAGPEPEVLQEWAQRVRRAVARAHAVPVSVVVLVKPGTLPRTTSGKRQRLRIAKLWRDGKLKTLAVTATAASTKQISLRERVASLLGVEVSTLDESLTLPELGLDSVRALELLAELEDQGGQLPIAMLLGLSLKSLHERLQEPAVPVETPWFQDAQLPAELVCGVSRPEPSGRVLVTGATGFLGGHIVLELLRTSAQQVLCLVRGGGGQRRLLEALAAHAGWRSTWRERVQVIEGDLSLPGLGLSSAAKEELEGGFDAVFHAGAMVNWVYPYAALAPSNVGGTLALLRLASQKATPFVYISTMACCWSLGAEGVFSEESDPMAHIEGIHLDYARSKAVSESLVRQAGERGVPVSILRPGLIFSNAETGQHSPGDFLSALFKGCIEMGLAPEMDWWLDVCPVDEVASLAVSRAGHPGTLHMEAQDRRPWRAVVLWMNLRGYAVKLVPYADWSRQLKLHCRDPEATLRPLLSFFTRPVPGLNGLRLPQLYEESRRNNIESQRSNDALRSLPRRALDAELLERAFGGLVASGFMPAPSRPVTPKAQGPEHRALFQACLERTGSVGLQVLTAKRLPWGEAGSEVRSSVIGELASWRYGQAAGLSRFELQLSEGSLPVVLKAQVPGDSAFEIGGEVAALCSEALGDAWRAHRHHSEVLQGDLREAALYRTQDPRFVAHTPSLHGQGPGQLVLEDLSGLPLMDCAEQPGAWDSQAIQAALQGIAQLHSVWLGETLDQDWLAAPRSSSSVLEQTSLWRALADFALSRSFGEWLGLAGRARYAELRADMSWASSLDSGPRTLIHNDFSPRNAALREDGRLCVYDWELASGGLPQRDLAEFLCFTLDKDTDSLQIAELVELHRSALEQASAQTLNPEQWRLGFGAALADLMVTRLPLYAMIDAFRPQRFLERVVGTWCRLDGWARELPGG